VLGEQRLERLAGHVVTEIADVQTHRH
jgi:hypothetical protein